MTYNDIYKKFLIEYDKADVTSSYPSLTKEEVVQILNKAYGALIAQKFIGRDSRNVGFEGDVKTITDLKNLVTFYETDLYDSAYIQNVVLATLPTDFLYFVQALIKGNVHEYLPARLVNHQTAEKFFVTEHNFPWVKTPVCYLEDQNIYIVKDPVVIGDAFESYQNGLRLTYIKSPIKFDSTNISNSSTEFECSNQMADELVSLAVIFALENIESSRLNSKINIRGIES